MRLRRLALGVAIAQLAVPSGVLAQAISAQDAAELRDEIARLKAQVDRLEARLGAATVAEPIATATTPAVPAFPTAPVTSTSSAVPVPSPAASVPETKIGWKGSPQFSSADARFKVKGRIQYDAGVLMAPAAVSDRAKGYSNELRRLRLGAEGMLGGGFGYKLETELSDNAIDLVDTFITYESGKWLLMLGNQNSFQSLDELVGDTTGSVMERAAFTDAFAFERRLGLSAQYRSGILLAQAGLFSDSADSLTNDSDGPDGGDENNSFSVDGRLVLAPKLGDTQWHFGASAHLRKLNRLAEASQRYRQRPYLHSVNSRYLATPSLRVDREVHYGAELAGVRGPLHWAGEAHWLKLARPGVADPTFFGGYAEVGYHLTGETRGYKNGIFTGTKPLRPWTEGGIGLVQLNLRYDYLDLDSRDILGGKQNALILGLIWSPIEYLRFNLNYGHLRYSGAAIPAGTATSYGVDVLGWRAELDF